MIPDADTRGWEPLEGTFGLADVSIAGAVSQEAGGGVRAFRLSALVSVVIPLLVTFVTAPVGLTNSVGLVFVLAASSLTPVLLLGVWWKRLTAAGAIAGMLTGSGCVALAVAITTFANIQQPSLRAVFEQPAAWTVPVATGVALLVSLRTRKSSLTSVDRFFLDMHAPERH